MKIVLFFELVWNVSAIPNKTEQNWQPWLYMDSRLTKTIPISLVNNCSSFRKRLILLKHNMVSQKHHSTRSYQPSFVWMILRLANYTTSPLNPPLPVHHLMHVSAKFINTLSFKLENWFQAKCGEKPLWNTMVHRVHIGN